MALRSEMSIKAISDYFDIPWDVVKNIEKSQLARDYVKVPLNKVTALGIDEICVFHHAKSDEKYVTVVRNPETGDVLHVGDGKGVKALEGFAKRIRRWRRHIRHVCMDMANAYAKWVGECLPDAEAVFDHFHVIKAMNDRLDKIRRRTMSKADEEMKKVRCARTEGAASRHLRGGTVRVRGTDPPRRLVRHGTRHGGPRSCVHGRNHREAP